MTRQSTPTLTEVLRTAIDRAIVNLHFALPASVEEYDASTQKINARPLIKRGYLDEDGQRQTEELPIVTEVPVVFPGAGGFRVTFPIQKGDTVLLVFAESSLDKWLFGGGVVDPEDDRRNDLTDAIAIVGLRPFSNPLQDAPTDVLSIGKDGGATTSFDEAEIRLGSDAASELAGLHSDMTKLEAEFAAWTPVANDGGAALKTRLTNLIATGWPFGATKVKVE